MGYYYADEDVFRRITSATGAGNCRHPLTYILEAADDLAYKTADIEDAFVKGFITYPALERELAVLERGEPQSSFRAADKLRQLYERGVQKGVRMHAAMRGLQGRSSSGSCSARGRGVRGERQQQLRRHTERPGARGSERAHGQGEASGGAR